MINNSKRIQLYKKLLRIRSVEYTISEKYHEQKMRCPINLSIGQEAIAVGICSNLKKEDKVFTAHRSHAHYLAKGGSLKKMIAELYGKFSGCAKGKGGSMHLIDLDCGILGAVAAIQFRRIDYFYLVCGCAINNGGEKGVFANVGIVYPDTVIQSF